MSELNVGAQEILAGFLPGNDNRIPVLNVASQLAVRQYFENEGLEMTAGCLTLGQGEQQTIDLVLSHDREILDKFRTNNESVVGPHFLGGEYSPDGIGIWTPES